MKRTGFLAILYVVLLIGPHAFADEEKVLFFEAALLPADTTLSSEPTGYSRLAEALTDSGMLLASMSSGVISREKLAAYEIVVLHLNRERPLGENEISALVWFVAQKGGALFVHGGPTRIANPLTEIFGITVDSSELVDTSSAMEGAIDGRQFLLTRFPDGPDFKFEGIKTIGFYGGPPLVLSQDAIELVTGDSACYSSNGVFSIGSFPPVAAIAYLGRGAILVKSDRVMLNNANVGAYQNMEWAKAAFATLATLHRNESQREQSLIGLRTRAAQLTNAAKTCSEQLLKYEGDLMKSYEKTKNLKKNLEELEKTNEDLSTKLSASADQIDGLNTRLARYESVDTIKIAVIVVGCVLLVVFIIGMLVGRRTMRGRV